MHNPPPPTSFLNLKPKEKLALGRGAGGAAAGLSFLSHLEDLSNPYKKQWSDSQHLFSESLCNPLVPWRLQAALLRWKLLLGKEGGAHRGKTTPLNPWAMYTEWPVAPCVGKESCTILSQGSGIWVLVLNPSCHFTSLELWFLYPEMKEVS